IPQNPRVDRRRGPKRRSQGTDLGITPTRLPRPRGRNDLDTTRGVRGGHPDLFKKGYRLKRRRVARKVRDRSREGTKIEQVRSQPSRIELIAPRGVVSASRGKTKRRHPKSHPAH
ncbi:hypothetical protein BHE74_00030409, partial [Ensete ventricosum]